MKPGIAHLLSQIIKYRLGWLGLFCLVSLLVLNYLTGFLYYLPHRTMIIYENKSNDIFVKEDPQYLSLDERPSSVNSWGSLQNLAITGWGQPNVPTQEDVKRLLLVYWKGLSFEERWEAFLAYCADKSLDSSPSNWSEFDKNGGYIFYSLGGSNK